METEKMAMTQAIELINMFNKALFSKTRLMRVAKLLIRKEEKIYALIMDIFNFSTAYNFFGNKMFSSRWVAEDNSVKDTSGDLPMTIGQAFDISKVFSEALYFPAYSKIDAEKIISNPKRLQTLVDDLFEMSPAFNLFEYRNFVKCAPLASFKEVALWNGDALIVCTADEVCEPFGFKSGDVVIAKTSILSRRETVIGVAPLDKNSDKQVLALCVASENEQFRFPGKIVVGAYTSHDLKERGVLELCNR